MNQFEQFTEEQDEWIRRHYHTMRLTDLTECFNKCFGKSRSYAVMKQRCRKTLKLTHLFTPEMDRFLAENYLKCSRKELADAFNEKFGQARSEASIKVRCQKLGLKFSDNKERIKSARQERNNVITPLGSTFQSDNGYLFVKTEKGWQLLHKVVWEKANGKKPDGTQIIFLDGDKTNCNLDNLYCVSGRVHRELIKNKWRFSDPEMTLLAIKQCELVKLVSELKG